jgi:hypothetical protein
LEDEGSIVADLAYAGAENPFRREKKFKKAAYAAMVYHLSMANKKWDKFGYKLDSQSLAKIERTKKLLSKAEVLDATRDCLALRYKGRYLFAMRGTAALQVPGDLLVDAAVVMNKRRIRRLEEAKQFVGKVLEQLGEQRPPQEKMFFYGHSLGGFIAEGAASFYPKSNCVTFQTATPFRKSVGNRPNSFNQVGDEFMPSRVVRLGDAVPGGISNMGFGTLEFRKSVGGNGRIFRSLKNHALSHYFSYDNVQLRKVLVGAAMENTQDYFKHRSPKGFDFNSLSSLPFVNTVTQED